MSFVSFAFLALLVIVLIARVCCGRSGREPWFLALLLAASIVFYSWHIATYLLILLASAGVDFFVGRRLAAIAAAAPERKRLLALSVVSNLGLLGFFKYYDFGRDILHSMLGAWRLGGDWLPALDLALPIGISFYTFQSMSYTIDIYRGEIRPIESFWRFLLFVSFFPQLVAGPIVRAREFLYQLERPRRPRLGVWLEGVYLVIRGFFLKMVLADNIAVTVEWHWSAVAGPAARSVTTLVVVFLFSCQIFCDFAGYSSIARGVAYLLGFRLPVNFNSPYVAGSFKEFWARWHVTLSRWLRDYLYISLGGNRVSPLRTYVNLMIVMLLGGLWHGAAWTFLVWGGLHGVALAIERFLGFERMQGRKFALLRTMWYIVVQGTVLVSWVFFRSRGLGEALMILRNAFSWQLDVPDDGQLYLALLLTVPVILMHLRTFFEERSLLPKPDFRDKALWSGVMLYLIITCYGGSSDFIYFQF